MSFVPLHLHTEYSYLDSMSKPSEIAQRCKDLGITACAITDHGHLTGIINFYKELKKHGVKPIIGQEFYCTHDHDHKDRKSRHLTVIAMNNEGLSNLYKLTSVANTPVGEGGGFYMRPRISWRDLEKYHKGLIVLSGCMNSWINHEFAKNEYDIGKEHATHLLKIFGKKRFFIELQNVNDKDKIYIPEQQIILAHSRKLAKDLGIRSCCTNDSHYCQPNDTFNHEVLKTIYSRATLADPVKKEGDKHGRMIYSGYFYYIPSEAEMLNRFTQEEVETTGDIAEMCNVDIPLKQDHMPKFDPDLSDNQVYEIMRKKCSEGFKRLGLDKIKNTQVYIDRARMELKDIKEAGLQNYFMIVWDVMNFCHINKIGTGYNRGSAGGSLILYLLNITRLDPIEHGLIWERFWNRGRKGSMPDIDLDIDIEQRDEVVKYLREKFGENRVFSMSTISTMSVKVVLKDVGKVVGLNFDYMNELTKHIPHKCTSIKNAIKDDEIIRNASNGIDKETIEWDKSDDPACKRLITDRQRKLTKTFIVAQRLEDIARQRSSHACAILIADEDIFGKIPLCWDATNKKSLTGWDMYNLEDLGYLKLDILGLKTISAIGRIHHEGVNHIKSFDDPKVFQSICRGNTKGIFQLESPLGKQWIVKSQPKDLESLSDLISIIRPAVLETGLAQKYVDNKNSENDTYEYIHPDLKPILDKTYGIMAYQEEMLEIVKKFAGFNLSKADLLRKACGKKLPKEMAKYEQEFIDGCTKNGYNNEIAKKLWEWINATASYSFNKCISGETYIYRGNNGAGKSKITIEHLFKLKNDKQYAKLHKQQSLRYKLIKYGYGEILALNKDNKIKPQKIKNIMFSGKKEVFRITLDNGKTIKATKDHKFLTTKGYLPIKNFILNNTEIICDGGYNFKRQSMRFSDIKITTRKYIKHYNESNIFSPGYINGSCSDFKKSKKILSNIKICQICKKSECKLEHHHIDGDRKNSKINNIQKLCCSCHAKADYKINRRKGPWSKGHKIEISKVKSIKYIGIENTYDIEMNTVEHNFVANGIVVSNSHAVGYAKLAYATAYFKLYYPEKFFLAMLQLSKNEQKPQEEISELFYDSKLFKVSISPPSIEKDNIDFEYDKHSKSIIYGLGHIKHVGMKSINKLKKLKIKCWDNVINNRSAISKDVLYSLILSGTFDNFNITRQQMKMQVDFIDILTPREQIFLKCLMDGQDYNDKKKVVSVLDSHSFNESVDLLLKFLNSENEELKIFNKNRALKLKEHCLKFLAINELEELPIINKAAYEITYLGIPATCSEVDIYNDKRKTHDIIHVKHEIENKELSTIGIIKRITERKDRRGNQFAFVTIFDKTYMIDIAIWSNVYCNVKDKIHIGSVVFLEGAKKRNLLSVNYLEVLCGEKSIC